ncbi:MAG TPA: chemotaxis protein CheX [Luteimonas sp.]|nr:chemotaxis protein CheX [Luteimonas sp.]
MAAKFLGQILLEQGLIDRQQLLDALDAQRSSNPKLGELAQSMGMLDYIQAARINERQRREDKRFGDIAQELRLLTADQVEALLEQQKAKRKLVGDILVERGVLSAAQLADALRAQRGDREQAAQALALGIAQHRAGSLLGPAVETCMRLFPRLLGTHCAFSSLAQSAEALEGYDVSARVRVKAGRPLWVGLAADRSTTARVAGAFLSIPAAECDDALGEDALGEFVNVLVGHIARDVVSDASDHRVLPPQFGPAAGELLAAEPEAMAVVLSTGLGNVVLLGSI